MNQIPVYDRGADILNVENVSVLYDRPILRDVNLNIKDIHRPGLTQGQVVALLAPSGMGKTQLFRCIAGLQEPSSGAVFVSDTGVKTQVKAGMVGVVPQNYLLFGHRTVYGNLLVSARLKGLSEQQAKERIVPLLEQFGLTQTANLYPPQLSGGQRQRVSILQQMLCSGHYLLMDEPFSGLDPILKEQAVNLIVDIASRDELNTIIVTTHDIESAISVADTICLLGRDTDATGNKTPGARIQTEYNLIERGLTWQPDIQNLPEFRELANEIKRKFWEL